MAVSVANAEEVATEDMIVKANGIVSPGSLPRAESVPVTVKIEGALRTRKGHEAARLSWVQLSLNKAATLLYRGLQACHYQELVAATSALALAKCSGALIGHGHVDADVMFPEQPRSGYQGNMLFFNGRVQGNRPAILVHVYSTNPRSAFILPFVISKQHGLFGTVLTAKVRISRWVHIRHFAMTIGRQFSFRGKRASYLTASCPAPKGFNVGIAPLVRVRFGFDNGIEADNVIVRSCRVRR